MATKIGMIFKRVKVENLDSITIGSSKKLTTITEATLKNTSATHNHDADHQYLATLFDAEIFERSNVIN